MKYYYLDEEKTTLGPFSVDEIYSLLQEGKVNSNTLIAEEGGTAWLPINSVKLNRSDPSETNVGNCPRCGKIIPGSEVPEICPHCQRKLHAGSSSISKNAYYAFGAGLRWKGRATRKEFWSYILLYLLVITMLVLGMVLLVNSLEDASLAILIGSIIVYGLGILLQLSLIGVTIRRLHDVGLSGWIVAALLASAAISNTDKTNGADMNSICLIFSIINLICVIVVLVAAFLPSQRGANKYGPSLIYPLGTK